MRSGCGLKPFCRHCAFGATVQGFFPREKGKGPCRRRPRASDLTRHRRRRPRRRPRRRRKRTRTPQRVRLFKNLPKTQPARLSKICSCRHTQSHTVCQTHAYSRALVRSGAQNRSAVPARSLFRGFRAHLHRAPIGRLRDTSTRCAIAHHGAGRCGKLGKQEGTRFCW